MVYARALRQGLSMVLAAGLFWSTPPALQAGSAEAPTSASGDPLTASELNETYGAWTLRCESRPGGADQAPQEQCFIFQNVVMKQSGQRVFNIAIGYVPETERPIALLTLPLGISLPPGVRLRVPDLPPMEFLIERCIPAGCRAGAQISEELAEALGTHATATVEFQDGSRQDLSVQLSLKGFSEALAALDTRR